MITKVHEKRHKNSPLTEAQKKSNKEKSRPSLKPQIFT